MSASPYRRPLRGVPRLPRRRSPWTRAGLALLVIATLPFMWSEDASCDAHPKPLVSGCQILFGKQLENPAPGGIFVGLLAIAIALGFLAAGTSRPWRRLAGEVVAGVASLGTSLLCVLMLTHGRPEQPLDHPAAWLGTLSSLAMAFQAWWGSGVALRRGLDQRRARKALVARIVSADPAPMRFAEVPVDEGDDDAPVEEHEEDGGVERVEKKRRRILR